MAAESLWWPLLAWLSSGAAWFVFFNAIVGVVAVLFWRQGGDATLSRGKRLTRSASTTGSEEAAKAETPEEMSVSLELDESCAVVRRRHALADLQPPPAAAAAAAAAMVERQRSRKREPGKVAEVAEWRAYAEVEEKAEVNARAERFIRQFREDLKLERLNSILNYSRCAGAAPAR